MRGNAVGIIIVLLLLLPGLSCDKTQHIGLWERHCEACHDGKTILNGKVVMGKEQVKERYRNLDEFANACGGAPSCMNILKHDKNLLRAVGKEMGIKNIPEK